MIQVRDERNKAAARLWCFYTDNAEIQLLGALPCATASAYSNPHN